MTLVTDVNHITHGLVDGGWPAGHVDARFRNLTSYPLHTYLTCLICIEWWRGFAHYESVHGRTVRKSNTG